MLQRHKPPITPPITPALAVGLLLLALLVYVWGLDGNHMMRNGDEMVYAHIARLTAQSGHWLPLLSDIPHVRNTKPPLLFWQAMVAGDWGNQWSLWRLRAPGVLYTLALCSLMALTLRRLTQRWQTAAAAVLIYLCFLSTYRYGRPYLTSAAETFWLSVPMWWLLWRTEPAQWGAGVSAHWQLPRPPGWGTWCVWGLAVGVGTAYKSFALVVPVAASVWVWCCWWQQPLSWRCAFKTGVQTVCMSGLALAFIAGWLWLDPNPVAVWQEFVLGENAGKMSNPQGYLATLFSGAGAVYLLAPLLNAGFLAPWLVAAGWAGVRSGRWVRGSVVGGLLLWLAVWWCVFLLPSQRSERYLIPAMPALAMLLAVALPQIGRWAHTAVVLLTLPCLVWFGRLGWVLLDLAVATPLQALSIAACVAMGLGSVLWLAGLLWRGITSPWPVLASVLWTCASLSGVFAVLNGPAGQFRADAARDMAASEIVVPSDFNGTFEAYTFVFPGHRFVPDQAKSEAWGRGEAGAEMTGRVFVWWSTQPGEQPACYPQRCELVDQRWDLKGRHAPGEVRLDNLWQPQTWLVHQEWLLRLRAQP